MMRRDASGFRGRRAVVSMLTALMTGLVVGWMIWSRPSRHDRLETAVVTVEQSGARLGSSPQYTCSMHPQVRSSNPKDKCPICGMDLIPVPAEETDEPEGDVPVLRLSPRALALMQVQVHPVERREVEVYVPVFGRLSVDETRVQTIAARVPGRLDRLHVNVTGAAVQAGEPMVEIYSPQLMAAQEELLQAVRAVRDQPDSGDGSAAGTTGAMLTAARERLRLLGLSREQITQIESLGQVREQILLPAPVSGIVTERLATPGDYVETGQPIYRLADLTHLWALLEIYEADLQWVALGQTATFSTVSASGERFTGTVNFIEPIVNPQTRTIRVRLEVPNPQGQLKPGMFIRGQILARVPLETGTPQNDSAAVPSASVEPPQRPSRPLVIPATAPLITGQRAVVYVQKPDADRPTFEPRDVVLGARAGPWYLVHEGLEEGERVVSHGAFKIDSELQIRGRPSMMQPAGGRPFTLDHGDASARHSAATSGAGLTPRQFQIELGRLVEANFALVEALAHDDPLAAATAADNALATLRAINPDMLTESTMKQAWQGRGDAMQQALMSITQAADLASQRGHFESFSDALIEAVRGLGVAQTRSVHRARCPMVRGRPADWLQPERTIRNPYLGASMLRCGEIIETFANQVVPGEAAR